VADLYVAIWNYNTVAGSQDFIPIDDFQARPPEFARYRLAQSRLAVFINIYYFNRKSFLTSSHSRDGSAWGRDRTEETSGHDRHCRTYLYAMEKCNAICGRAGGIESRETPRQRTRRGIGLSVCWIGTCLKSVHRSVRSIFSTYVTTAELFQ